MKNVILAMLGGESMPRVMMTVIRFCVNTDSHELKKLLTLYWEVRVTPALSHAPGVMSLAAVACPQRLARHRTTCLPRCTTPMCGFVLCLLTGPCAPSSAPLTRRPPARVPILLPQITPKYDASGKLLSEMILVCNALLKDLHHPNEFVRGSMLRFLCKLQVGRQQKPRS